MVVKPKCVEMVLGVLEILFIERELLKKEKMTVETKSGIKTIEINVKDGESISFKVDMGLTTFKTSEVPMMADEDEFLDGSLDVLNETFNLTAISVGNPYAIIFVENIDEININKFAPAIETHEAFS